MFKMFFLSSTTVTSFTEKKPTACETLFVLLFIYFMHFICFMTFSSLIPFESYFCRHPSLPVTGRCCSCETMAAWTEDSQLKTCQQVTSTEQTHPSSEHWETVRFHDFNINAFLADVKWWKGVSCNRTICVEFHLSKTDWLTSKNFEKFSRKMNFLSSVSLIFTSY